MICRPSKNLWQMVSLPTVVVIIIIIIIQNLQGYQNFSPPPHIALIIPFAPAMLEKFHLPISLLHFPRTLVYHLPRVANDHLTPRGWGITTTTSTVSSYFFHNKCEDLLMRQATQLHNRIRWKLLIFLQFFSLVCNPGSWTGLTVRPWSWCAGRPKKGLFGEGCFTSWQHLQSVDLLWFGRVYAMKRGNPHRGFQIFRKFLHPFHLYHHYTTLIHDQIHTLESRWHNSK